MWKQPYLSAILLTLTYTILFTESTSVGEPHWVSFNPDTDELPSDAIIGGYEDNSLYIGRTLNGNGYMVPGKYDPSTRQFIMPYFGKSYIRNISEILCGYNYTWVKTTKDNIPDGAVAGGFSDANNETMYIGRVFYRNNVIPGKVKKSYWGIYIPYNDVEVHLVLESFEILVAVKIPQIVIQNFTVYEVVEPRDSSLRIPCVATGSPKPTITWRVNGRIITEPDLHVTTPYVPQIQYYSQDNKFSVDNGILVFNEPKVTDSQTYITCEAYNDAGSDNLTFQVNVRQEPKIAGKVNLTAVRGQNVNIECNVVAGVPIPTISWEFRAINDSRFVSVPGSDNTLNISNVDGTDAGTYKCIATNNVGDDEHLTELIVQSELEIIYNTTEEAVIGYTLNVISNPNLSLENESLVIETLNMSNNVLNRHVGFENTTTQVQTLQCLISRKPDTDRAMPLVLIPATIWPTLNSTTDYLQVEPGQTVMFSCHNSGNKSSYFQKFPERDVINASCIGQDKFVVEDKSYKISELLCTEVQTVVINKHEICLSETSELLSIGYEVYGFSETYEVCFDTAKKIPLYSHVKMSKINRGGDVTYKWDKYGALDAHRDTYTCDNATSSCCYRKAQLVNARDVSAGLPHRTTFIDPLNAVPHWRPCGMAQSPWENIEETVRSQIESYDQIDVWSGTHMLHESNGTVTPRHLWKVLRFDDTKSIAVVYVNGPSPSEADILCKNTCGDDEAVPWSYNYNEYTYCCNVDEFLHAFGLGGSVVGKPTASSFDTIVRKKFFMSSLLLKKLKERTSIKQISQNIYFEN